MFDVVYNDENAIVLPYIFVKYFERMKIKLEKKRKAKLPTLIGLTTEHAVRCNTLIL